MSRWQWVLVAVLVVEVAGGAVYLGRHVARPRPPLPDLALVDASTAQDIRDRAATCYSAEDWRKLAATLFAAGFFSESEACYRQALEMGPQRADLHYDWGFLLSQMGRMNESNHQFRQALDLGYTRPDHCWYFVGRNYLRLEQPDKAAEAFGKGTDLLANRYEWSRILYRQGRLDKASDLAEAVQRADPRAIEANFMSHRIELALGHTAKADEYHELGDLATHKLPTPFMHEWYRLEKIRKQEMSFERHYDRAHELMNAGKFEPAAEVLRQMIQEKWDAPALDRLAFVEEKRGNSDQAVRLLEEILERLGPSSKYLEQLGVTLEEIGRLEKAREAWQQGLAVHSQENLKSLCSSLQESYARSGDEDKVKYYLARVAFYVGVEKFRAWEFPMAEKALSDAVSMDPNLTQAWFYLGEARRWLNEKEPAREAYERCLQLNPQHGRALLGLQRLNRKNSPADQN
jgi:tetratricopeptide (TPR) repeat protein